MTKTERRELWEARITEFKASGQSRNSMVQRTQC